MSLALDIITYLAQQGHGTYGTDLFRGGLPADPTAAVAVIPTVGLADDYIQESSDPAYQNPRFQVLVRAATYDAAEVKAEAVYAALARVTNTTLSGTRYLSLRPLQQPFLLRRDENRNVEFTFNCQAVRGA